MTEREFMEEVENAEKAVRSIESEISRTNLELWELYSFRLKSIAKDLYDIADDIKLNAK